MQIDPVSVVRWSITPGAKGDASMEGLDASTISRLGAHLEFSAPVPAPHSPTGQALTMRSLETSFKNGMKTSFTTQPMAELIDAQRRSDLPAMTIAMVKVTDAATNVSLLSKMTSSVINGIKTLTTQSG